MMELIDDLTIISGSIGPTHVQLEDVDYLSKFCIPKATRKQSGKYTITATNVNGTDSGEQISEFS